MLEIGSVRRRSRLATVSASNAIQGLRSFSGKRNRPDYWCSLDILRDTSVTACRPELCFLHHDACQAALWDSQRRQKEGVRNRSSKNQRITKWGVFVGSCECSEVIHSHLTSCYSQIFSDLTVNDAADCLCRPKRF